MVPPLAQVGLEGRALSLGDGGTGTQAEVGDQQAASGLEPAEQPVAAGNGRMWGGPVCVVELGLVE